MRIETFVHFISASSVYEPIDRCVSLIAGLTIDDLTYHAGLTTRLSPANKIENKVSQILKSEKIIVSTAHIVWRIGTDSSAKYCIITFVENLTLFVTPVNFMSRKVTCPDFATGQFSSSR